MPALTRGPLPPRVYWVRRLLVVTTALLLVVGIARLLGDGSDASSGSEGRAAQAAADTTPGTTPDVSAPVTATDGADPTAAAGDKGKKGDRVRPDKPVLAQPDGECVGSDIAVTPKVDQAVAGRDVQVVLQLRTLSSEACTWRVSHSALTLDITSGKDDIWSSRQCPRAVPVRDVVVRRDVTTNVAVTWRMARRSDSGCTPRTDWAMPGWYHVTAAALGGEPSDLQFELTTPTAATITMTATPTNTPSDEPAAKASDKPSNKASGKPSGQASGSAD